jgi:hypothetical protein
VQTQRTTFARLEALHGKSGEDETDDVYADWFIYGYKAKGAQSVRARWRKSASAALARADNADSFLDLYAGYE